MAKETKKQEKRKGRWGLYEIAGGLKRKNRFCPKCGQGVFMATHKDRYTCGRCNYTEFVKSEKK